MSEYRWFAKTRSKAVDSNVRVSQVVLDAGFWKKLSLKKLSVCVWEREGEKERERLRE